MRREKSLRNGVHHADAVVWGPVYGTRLRGFRDAGADGGDEIRLGGFDDGAAAVVLREDLRVRHARLRFRVDGVLGAGHPSELAVKACRAERMMTWLLVLID